VVAGQRVPGLHFDDPRVLALFTALCLFLTLPEGFRNATLRTWMAQALGVPEDAYSSGRMTYDLRRLRLHGLIERTPHSYRYQVTDLGLRVALFFTKVHSRILRPGLSQLFHGSPKAPDRPIATAMGRLHQALVGLFEQAKLAPAQT
jgi:predicted MarR family transcription regulator